MTKQEALAILERNADPYLADPAELAWLGRTLDILPLSAASCAARNFRYSLEAFRVKPAGHVGALRGDDVLHWRENFTVFMNRARAALTA